MDKKIENEFEKVKAQFDSELYLKAKATFKSQLEKLETDKGTLKFNFSEFFNLFEKEQDQKFPKALVDRFMLDLIFRIGDLMEIGKDIVADLVKDGLIFDGHERYEPEGSETMLVLDVIPMKTAKKHHDI